MKYLRNLMLAVSTALFYNACMPPEKDSEEDLESKCQGEVLFEDEFEGKELDFNKWEPEVCGAQANYQLNNGILEMNVGDGNCGLQSRSTYTLDDRTLCFEARWKVREREGVTYAVGLSGENGFINCDVSVKGRAGCWNYISSGESVNLPSDINPIDWHTYIFDANGNRINYRVDNVPVGSTNTKIPINSELNIDVSCQSEDDREKHCEIDYVKLSR